MLSSMLARGKIKLTQVSASLVFFWIQFYTANEIPHSLLFLDSTYTVFTHFLMQMNPLKQLLGENPLCSCYNGWDACRCYSGQSFWWCYYDCRATASWRGEGLSSLAHLPTSGYGLNIHIHAVYFHINKAHPLKLGCEFNLEAGISAILPRYLCVGGKYTATANTPSSLFLLYLIHVWHNFFFFCVGASPPKGNLLQRRLKS